MQSSSSIDYFESGGLRDTMLRPALIFVKTSSGFRPAEPSDFSSSATLTVSGINITGIVDNEQVTQIAGSGTLATASKAIVDSLGRISVAISDAVPSSQAVYSIALTGIGAFSNYSPSIPNIQGVVSLSIEPDSNNTDPVYYAFSGQAVTGNAFELRGDKVFSVANTTDVYFAQATSGQRVMAHYQKY